MIEVITYTSIVILIIIVIYQKLTIWGLESELQAEKYLVHFMKKAKYEHEAKGNELLKRMHEINKGIILAPGTSNEPSVKAIKYKCKDVRNEMKQGNIGILKEESIS